MFKIYKQSFFYLIAAILLSGCFGLFDNDFDSIVAEYNVGWVDTEETRGIQKAGNIGDTGGEGIVPAYVFQIGHNAKFIVAKQHPLSEENGKVDLKTTNYFVIDYSKHPYAKQEGIYGPMNFEKYQTLSGHLSIGSIEFDMIYPNDPD